jgi:hypothetical protein
VLGWSGKRVMALVSEWMMDLEKTRTMGE